MMLQDRILKYLEEKAVKPLSAEEIAAGMELTHEDLIEFDGAMEELETRGSVLRNSGDLYGIPSRMHLVVGRLSMSLRKFGFVIPDVRNGEEDTDVYIPPHAMETAMHNDRVVARISPSSEPGRSREGEIIRVLERANTRIVGTFEKSRSFGFVTPDDTRLGKDIFIPKKCSHKAKTGSKVVVEITRWPEGKHQAEGTVIEVLGQQGDPGVDILSIMRGYGLSDEFPEEVQQAASETEQEPSPEEYRGRKDRRDFRIVTVDGEDAKDLDDGVYAEKRRDGGYFLGVYIADVSWYVRENRPLDHEARERGTSVYLVDRVIPMLPRELSNGICSLNAGVDRLSMACEMELDREGRVIRYEILPVVIHVYRRLTYHLVNKVLVDREQPYLDDQADILPMLEHLAEIRDLRKKLRGERGSIDFELPEIKVKLDSDGHPTALVKREGSLAESIIEECMLAANETVAEYMEKKQLPFVYRVHEQPGREKMEQLNRLLAAFGLHVRIDEEDKIRPGDIQQVLEKVKGRPEERMISAVSLRSMQQARYSTESLGHFGLAARYYTHFTSPIRRYPDLIVHRLLRETFGSGTISRARQEQLRTRLPEIAEHASKRERIAMEAERETVRLKEIEYMAQFVGETFRGIISGVTAFGIFVELENGVEGLVHVSSMAKDYYTYLEDRYALAGQSSHQEYRLGDEVEVVLLRVNLEEKNLDLVLKDNSVYDTSSPEKLKKAGNSAGKPRHGGKKPGDEKKSHRGKKGGKPSSKDLIAFVSEKKGSGGKNGKKSHSGKKHRHHPGGGSKQKTKRIRNKG